MKILYKELLIVTAFSIASSFVHQGFTAEKIDTPGIEQNDLDNKLLWTANLQNIVEFSELLDSTKLIQPSQEAVDESFSYAIALESIDLINIFYKAKRLQPSYSLVVEQFEKLAEEGSNPDIIYALQKRLKPEDLKQQRDRFELLLRGNTTHRRKQYIVMPSEENYIKNEWEPKFNKFTAAISLNNPEEKKESENNFSIWLSEQLMHSVKLNHRLTVSRLLRLRGAFELTQQTLAGALIEALNVNNMTIATLLCDLPTEITHYNHAKLFANKSAINFAFNKFMRTEYKNIAASRFLLNHKQVYALDPLLVAKHYSRLHINLADFVHHPEKSKMLSTTRPLNEDKQLHEYIRYQLENPPEDLAKILEYPYSSERYLDSNLEKMRLYYNNQVIRLLFTNVPNNVKNEVMHSVERRRQRPYQTNNLLARMLGSIDDYHKYIVAMPLYVDEDEGEDEEDEEETEFLSLNQAIINHIDLDAAWQGVPQPALKADVLKHLIADKLRSMADISTRSTADNIRILFEVLEDKKAVKIVGEVFKYIHKRYPDAAEREIKIQLWIHGFLSETPAPQRTFYSNRIGVKGVEICTEGAVNRAVTGLRGLEDPELDSIFAKAEGPLLVRMFIKNAFNIFYKEDCRDEARTAAREPREDITQKEAHKKAIRLARELVRRGATPQSTMSDIENLTRRYISDFAQSHEVDEDTLEDDINVVVEFVVDGYRAYLQSYVNEIYIKTIQHRARSAEAAGAARSTTAAVNEK